MTHIPEIVPSAMKGVANCSQMECKCPHVENSQVSERNRLAGHVETLFSDYRRRILTLLLFFISSDATGKLPIKLIVPITDWKDAFIDNLWHVRIAPDSKNGLLKPSASDALQVRGVDQRRFVKRLGRLGAQEVEDVAAAIAMVVEYA